MILNGLRPWFNDSRVFPTRRISSSFSFLRWIYYTSGIYRIQYTIYVLDVDIYM